MLILPFALVATLVAAVGSFVAYVLWPTWPNAAIPRDVPAIPITIAGVLFNVPPAAIRATVQRHPGAHERVDLAFLWPSLAPPQTDTKRPDKPAAKLDEEASAAAPANASDRLFVTISGLGATLAPIERLRSIYPRYLEAQATAGPDGLASLPFRGGTPYQGEDLVYVAEKPEQFFARCTRRMRAVPGTCIHERSLDAAEITLRFPREWLDDWRGVAGGFDRLLAELHPRAGDARLKIND
ncbi:MAG TPA: hypothetical protein VK430_09505 [Xanthobacteraceae bacterium]|nr:hypothetical protein [Xanthobacteraceae bacterium]